MGKKHWFLLLLFLVALVGLLAFISNTAKRQEIAPLTPKAKRETGLLMKKRMKKLVSVATQEKAVSRPRSNEYNYDKDLDEGYRALLEMKENCDNDFQTFFADKKIFDPASEYYKDPNIVVSRADEVLNTLTLKEEREFHFIIKEVASSCNIKSLKRAKKIFSEVGVCRDQRVIYFFETIFEASLNFNYSDLDKLRVVKYMVVDLSSILYKSESLDNLLFVLSILKKMPKNWLAADVEFIVLEAEDIYRRVFESWEYYSDIFNRSEDPRELCLHYQEYFEDSDIYKEEVDEIIDELGSKLRED